MSAFALILSKKGKRLKLIKMGHGKVGEEPKREETVDTKESYELIAWVCCWESER